MEWDTTLRPLVESLGLELYDVEFSTGTLNVVVNRPGGVDVEALTKINRTISEWLDANDPIPGRFTLDVSSPGLERRLRTIEHFRSAVGETVTLREQRKGQPTRRLEGPLVRVGDTTVILQDQGEGEVEVALASVERARTVFQWGGEAKPSPSRGTPSTTTSKKG
jgi:ribosome maturation factor RimP